MIFGLVEREKSTKQELKRRENWLAKLSKRTKVIHLEQLLTRKGQQTKDKEKDKQDSEQEQGKSHDMMLKSANCDLFVNRESSRLLPSNSYLVSVVIPLPHL